jgi:eukaryotic-like serine/threonine-protein kinase
MLSVKAGDVVAGKYLLEHVIGQGGVGVIASAQHLILRQRVALKFLRPELSRQPDVVLRFLREAQAVAQIKGEHVARVMDAGTIESGEAFFVMEYLEGHDLAAHILEHGPLSIDDSVDYLVQACEALAEAHALGIVHRDLKPANLFLTRAPDGSPFVKVLDFGLSKLAEVAMMAREARDELTADHHMIGSPHFMSPEQMRSPRDVDRRSDVWALGAVLYTFLAGRVPFDGKCLSDICAAVLDGRPVSIRVLRPDVSEGLEAVILGCLQTHPEQRYDSVASLALALAPFAPARALGRARRIGRVLEAARAPDPRRGAHEPRRKRRASSPEHAGPLVPYRCRGIATLIAAERSRAASHPRRRSYAGYAGRPGLGHREPSQGRRPRANAFAQRRSDGNLSRSRG